MRDRPVHAVVFDMDGTLLDSLPVVLECYRTTIVEFGGPSITRDDVLSSFAIGPAAVMLETLIGRPVGQEAVACYERHLSAGLESVTPYPGIPEALEPLSEALPLGVFTAADTSAAELLLGATGLREAIGPVIGADRVARSKPAPDGVLAVCAMLGLPPTNAAYVGDGPADVPAARACGALAVAVAWGHQYRENRDADVTVRSPLELLDLFGVPRALCGDAR
jgi:phosphoglycolate phosphatase/AHBA synthesis associated protein